MYADSEDIEVVHASFSANGMDPSNGLKLAPDRTRVACRLRPQRKVSVGGLGEQHEKGFVLGGENVPVSIWGSVS